MQHKSMDTSFDVENVVVILFVSLTRPCYMTVSKRLIKTFTKLSIGTHV